MNGRFAPATLLRLFGSLALVLGSAWTFPAPCPPGGAPGGAAYGLHAPGEILIKFEPGARAADRSSARALVQGQGLRRFRSGAEHWRVGRGLSTEKAIEILRRHPRVAYVEPNYIVRADASPDDPRYPELWGLANTGQTGGVPGSDIRAESAWNTSVGSRDVLVAVIDSGIDYTHPDLAANVWTNSGEIPANGLDDDGNGFIDDVRGWDFYNDDNDPRDDFGHGTHVAGTIGAVGDNGIGVAGVSWRVSLVALKFLGAGGSGSTAGAIAALDYAASIGARVTNNSWGGGAFSQALLDSINGAGIAGSLFVAAAGNSSLDTDISPRYPSSYSSPYIISVASTDHGDQRSPFSNFGRISVDLGAPGSSILSTLPGDAYGFNSGTSMATPHVSGAAALVLSVRPGLAPETLKQAILDAVDRIPALAGITVTGGRLNAHLAIASPDSIPPGAIIDLTVASTASNSVRLTWTATGEDDRQGRASSYDLRWSHAPIDAGSFDSATPVAGAPTPAIAGTAESFEVTGLSPSVTYHFAIRAVDEWTNAGPVSNDAAGTTLPPPAFASSPSSFDVALFTGGRAAEVLDIRNAGPGTLDWRLMTRTGGAASASRASLPLAKGQADERPGDALTPGTGGPDGHGYRFVDSDQAGGPAFSWEEISETGTPVASLDGDDQVSVPVDLGFRMPFYGDTYEAVRISTDGWLGFTPGSPSPIHQPLPCEGAPASLIAPLWTDLDFQGAKRVRYARAWDRFTIQFTDVARRDGTGRFTFQVVLHESGQILFKYLSIAGDPATATVGIQGGPSDDGLLVAFNAPYVHEGLAVEILPPATWLTAGPAQGRLLSGEIESVTVGIDAFGLRGGTYSGSIDVATNDPDNPIVTHEVTLEVTDAPDIVIATGPLDFGEVFAGFSALLPVSILNAGTADLIVSSITSPDPTVTSSPSSLVLEPGEIHEAGVSYSPSVPGGLSSTLVIESNAPGDPAVTIPVSGTAVPPPAIRVSPTSLSRSLSTGQSATQSLTVTNVGATDLLVALSTEVSAPPAAGRLEPAPARRPRGTDGREIDLQRSEEDGWTPGTDGSSGAGEAPPIEPASSAQIVNGGFESASFAGWTAYSNGRGELLPWSVSGGGAGWFGSSSPREGSFDALNGFDGDAGLRYTLIQDITLPAVFGDSVLSFYDRIQYDSLGIASSLPRIYEATIRDTSGAVLAVIAREEIRLAGRSYTDLGWQRRSIDLRPWSGRTVRLQIDETIPESYTGPALIEFDEFRLGSQIIPEWLSVAPATATIPPGLSLELAVTFSAGSSGTEQYVGAVRIDSSDPAAPTVRVPALLSVVGAPDIRLEGHEEIDFGPAFVGASSTRVFAVLNVGSDPLVVSSVLPDGHGFTASPSGFTVAPGASREVEVTFAPPTVGSFSATLTIASDDPDTPAATVAMVGEGLEPPVASVAPSSLTSTLLSGQEETRILTLSNAGGSPLEFEVSAAKRAAPSVPCDIETLLVSSYSSGKLHTVDVATGAVGDLATGLEGPIAGLSVDGAGENAYLAEADGGSVTRVEIATGSVFRIRSGLPPPGGLDLASNESKAYVTLFGEGALEEVDLASGAVTTVATGLGAPYGVALDPSGSIAYVAEYGSQRISAVDLATGAVTTVASHIAGPFDLTLDDSGSRAYVADLGGNRVALVDLATGAVSTVAVLGGRPAGIALDPAGDTLFVTENQAGIVSSVDVASGAVTPITLDTSGPAGVTFLLPAECRGGFLTASPASGTVPAFGSRTIEVRVSADGLDAGRYEADLLMDTNDPLRPELIVPATLAVTGFPVIVTDPEPLTLDFGQVFPGASARRSFTVRNGGSDRLTVASISADRTQYVASPGSFDLEPREEQVVTVDFAPLSAGAFDGTLTIESDDPNRPALPVPLVGSGVEPPIVGATPAALEAALFTGQSETRVLTLTNGGASDLTFSLRELPLGITAMSYPFAGLTPDAPWVPGGNAAPAPGAAAGDPDPEDGPAGPGLGGGGDVSFTGLPGDFEILAGSPAPLTCVAGDAASGLLYAQRNQGTDFYRYVASANRWEPLRPAPISSGNNGGAALLGGKVYTVYTGVASSMGIYDVAAGSWSEIPNPLMTGTSNIASDGVRYLYLIAGTRLVRFDPAASVAASLAPAPVAFTQWGGLEHFEGRLYGHTGDGSRGFASYDVATDTWLVLPQVPGGAVLGSALDPIRGVYAAYGSYGGRNLYEYEILGGSWKVRTVPFFALNDGGMAWLPEPVSAVHFVQGELGTGLARLVTGFDFVDLGLESGTVPPGGSLDVGVTFRSAGLPVGAYQNQISIRSNDPLTPELPVPVRLTVAGAPRLKILGAEVRLQSRKSYSTLGASTSHTFANVAPAGGSATLRLLAEGDYGASGETATLIVEGRPLGSAGGAGLDCAPVSRDFVVAAPDLAAFVADGVLDVVVQNSATVDVFCPLDRHTVELVYSGPAGRLDFGEVFLGFVKTRSFRISNDGTEPLLASLASPFPDCTVSPASVSLPPGASAAVTVTFRPSAPGEQSGALVIESNDPVEPRVTLDLTGVGFFPPVAGHDPAALTGIATEGGTDVRRLTITNTGGSDLDFTLDAAGVPFLSLSPAVGSVPAGGSLEVDVTFTAGGLAPGVRAGAVVLSSNDPVTPAVSVPVTFLVRGIPSISFPDPTGPARFESSKPFTLQGRATSHSFSPVPPPDGAGSLEVTVQGDFAFSSKSASVHAEGIFVGTAGQGSGGGCVAVSRLFTLSESDLGALASDGIIEVTVANSIAVLSEECAVNTHAVKLTYGRSGAGPIDFGEAMVGASKTRSLVIRSAGTDVLEVTVAAGLPEFAPSPASLSIFPGESKTVTIAFSPTAVGAFSAALVVSSNDPARPSVAIDLSGLGMPAPAARVEPVSFEVALPPGGTTVRHMEISNTGDSDLLWEVEAVAPGSQAGASAPAWLTVSPRAGAVPPGGSVDVAVGIDAGLAPAGDSAAIVSVTSNDPTHARIDATVLLHAGFTELDHLDVEPDTLNLSSSGRTVRGWLQLPVHLDPREVLIATVAIDGQVFAEPGEVTLGDENDDGVEDLAVKFDRAALEAILGEGRSIAVAVTGEVRDKAWFRGTDHVRVIRPRLVHPVGGEHFVVGEGVVVAWEPPEWQGAVAYTLLLSRDGGETWETLAAGLAGVSYGWTPSGAPTDRALLRVIASDARGVIGYDSSDAFVIAEALRPPRSVTGLEAAIDAGDLVLAWPAPPADLLHGPAQLYRVMEAESPAGPWVELDVSTSTSLRVTGGGLGPRAAFYKVAAVNAAGEAEAPP